MVRIATTASDSRPADSVALPLRFRAIQQSRAFEEVAAQIRAELADGRLQVGSRLPSERVLADQFGVSRHTLREALRSLENAGLVRLQKGAAGGAFITEGSSQVIGTGLLDMYHVGKIHPSQLTEARIWLEGVIVREACKRATRADIGELKANIDAAEEATRQGDFARRVQIHMDFHRILARMTGNPVILALMNGVLDVLSHFINRIGHHSGDYVHQSRRRFMKHLMNRDAGAAAAEMEASLKRLQRDYMSIVENTDKTQPDTPARVPRKRLGAATKSER